MLFKNETVLIYLSSSALRLFTTNRGFVGQHDFDSKDFTFLEVQNKTDFETSVSNFLDSNSIVQSKVVILLADDLIFSKSFSSLDATQEHEYIQEFLGNVPFNPSDIMTVAINEKDSVTVYATNSEPYNIVKKVAEYKKCTVNLILPAIIADPNGLLKENITESKSVKYIIKTAKARNDTDFINRNINIKVDPVKRDTNILAVVAVISVVLVSGFVVYKTFFSPKSPVDIQKPPKQVTQVKDATETPPESTESVQIQTEYLLRKDIRVSVVNGTRIAGEATKIKNLLLEQGFVTIETDNTEEINQDLTTVFYSDTVSPEDKDLVLNLFFPNVTETTESAQNPPESDIIITTGLKQTD